MTEKYIIEVNRPAGVSKKELIAYMEEAVSLWCRGGNPEDPLWDLYDNDLKIKSFKE